MFDVLFIICLYHRPFDLSLLRLVGPNSPLFPLFFQRELEPTARSIQRSIDPRLRGNDRSFSLFS